MSCFKSLSLCGIITLSCALPIYAESTTSTPAAAIKADIPTHSVNDLSRFYIPEFTVYNASAARALDKFIDQYQQTCFRTGETPIRFQIDKQSLPSTSLNFTTSGSFTHVLDSIAFRLKMEVKTEQNTIRFSPIKKNKSSANVATKHFHIQPDFLVKLFEGSRDTSHLLQQKSPLEQFKNNFMLTDSTHLSLSKDQSVFTVTAPQADIDRIKKIINSLYAQRPAQVRVSTKIIQVPSSLDLKLDKSAQKLPAKTLLSNGEIQMIMKQFATCKGCNIRTAPSIVCRDGEYAQIAIMRECLIEKEPTPQFTWTGLKLGITSSLCGFGSENIVHYEQRPHLTGNGITAHRDFNFKQKAKLTEFTYIPANHYICFKINEVDGMTNHLFLSVNGIDATGKTLFAAKQ